jgi:kumamolisin
MSRNSWKLAVSRGVCAVLFSAIPSFIMASPAQAQSFLTRHVRQTVISGKAKFLKRLPATQTLRLDIVLPVRDQAGMDKLFREIYDPSSPSFRHFLKGTEFMERFGPTQEDYDSLIGYLTSHGFEILRGSRDGRDVQFEGSVASIEAAFNVSMGVYQHPTEKRTFYAPDREPTVGLPFPLWHISGLDNFSIPHRAFQKNSGVVSEAGTGSGYSSSFLGSDMRAAYYGSGSLTGSGQSLALFELYFCANYIDSECYLYNGIDNADEENYFSTVGQTNSVTIVPIAVANNVPTTCLITDPCDDTEDTVDITQAVSMAPGLSDLFVFVGSSPDYS